MARSLFLRTWVATAVVSLLHSTAFAAPAPPPPSAVVEILEDDADGLLGQLNNPTGDPGTGFAEHKDVFSGKSAIKIVPMQRFSPKIAGWGYRIAEKPKVGEYRYLRFAWRADGARGIMLQMHDEKDWRVRLTAGIDMYNWGTKFVAPAPPPAWTVVTRDLFTEFGGVERTIQGIALTVFDGRAGYFDHIYLARTIDDLDRIDATGLRNGPPPQLNAAKLDELWRDLAGTDAAKSYLAFWTLANAPEQAVPFVGRTLAWPKSPEAAKQVEEWIRQLDADAFEAREAAANQLAEHPEAALELLKRELEETASPEVRRRIEQLLESARGNTADATRTEKAVRLLEYTATPAARKCLEDLSGGDGATALAKAAKEALKRTEVSPGN